MNSTRETKSWIHKLQGNIPKYVILSCGLFFLFLTGLAWTSRTPANYELSPIIQHFVKPVNENAPDNEQTKPALRYTDDPRIIDLIPKIDTGPVDCLTLFTGDNSSMPEVLQYQNTSKPLNDSIYINLTKNCTYFIRTNQYITKPLSQEEMNFPIAYTIMVYMNVAQFEHLLRAIYQPQNYYCIHIDGKADMEFKLIMSGIVDCFHNVFISSESINVSWGQWSVVEAELACIRDLMKIPDWKYHLNLAGTEFPLKTNWELVQILKAFNGSNLVDSLKSCPIYRYATHFEYYLPTRQKEAPPFQIIPRKGYFLAALTRAFCDFIISDEKVKVFQDWVNDTDIPDETFFSTLNTNPQMGAPGGYTGNMNRHNGHYPSLSRFVRWKGMGCEGEIRHQICVFGVGDLPLLHKQPQLFLNKLDINFHPSVYKCMEQLHFNRTRKHHLGQVTDFNRTFYSSYEFTWNHQ